jgi:hypothetical protein
MLLRDLIGNRWFPSWDLVEDNPPFLALQLPRAPTPQPPLSLVEALPGVFSLPGVENFLVRVGADACRGWTFPTDTSPARWPGAPDPAWRPVSAKIAARPFSTQDGPVRPTQLGDRARLLAARVPGLTAQAGVPPTVDHTHLQSAHEPCMGHSSL